MQVLPRGNYRPIVPRQKYSIDRLYCSPLNILSRAYSETNILKKDLKAENVTNETKPDKKPIKRPLLCKKEFRDEINSFLPE